MAKPSQSMAGGAMQGDPMRVVNVHQAKTHLSRMMPLAAPVPQRIPGRLRSRGPLSQPNVLLEPTDPSELELWELSPLLP
ncbi:hypothetical protein [Cyanobium sp. HWJ4-Hawea]|uniref:hypothetical protein n=1 Tax=Cyanobium sp. HWJ4-Hawea TaxID=2823713 RepID=UPI0020CC1077|nr:hypothetical protein [Cyanobium sp. HWJ4-Hawea]